MELDKIKDKLPEKLYAAIAASGIAELRPSQVKSVEAGKLAGELLERMTTKGEVMPPHYPFPFWDHRSIMDELESTMNTTEFLSSSQEKQKIVLEFWDRCRNQLAEIMERQQSAATEQATQSAVAQATQQAAAQAAAEAIQAARGQIQAAVGEAPQAQEQFARAQAESGGQGEPQ